MKRIVLAAGLTVVFAFFQNCQQARYSGVADAASSKAGGEETVVTVETEDEVDETGETGGEERPGPLDESGSFVCILEGPGKSVKLALQENGNPGGQNKVPRVMCMSQLACLDIAAQKFDVKGAYFRGYCKSNGNPHVVHVTNAELQDKIDKL